jgi:cell fate regulator YaaT (PSP1 superfamily)
MFDLPEWTGEAVAGATAAMPQTRFVGVRFEAVGKIYHYTAGGFDDLKVGDWVIVDTARGKQMAQVASLKAPKDAGVGQKRIERRATGRDMAMRHYYEGRELEAMIACRVESAALRLPIKIVRAEYSFDGQTLTLLYSSDQEERVEAGALREAMSRLYRARIEMRQISPREVAKILGGMGACGIEERCCSRFLTEFSPISIKHAKEQNLSLNPHDITGMCGRLRCCLVYE